MINLSLILQQLEDHLIYCKNCGAKLAPESRFCQACGQRTKLGRLTIREIISEFLSSVFNIDAPFPKTLSKMFFKPHIVIKDFIDGKRKTYYAPVKYMVLCLFINILIGELIGFDPLENQREIDTGAMDEQSIQGYKAGDFLNRNLNFFLFLLPFSIAIFGKLFFWKSRFNFAERTAMGFYLAGQFIVISLLPILLSKWNAYMFYFMFPLSILYFTYAFYKLFEMSARFGRLLLSFFTACFAYFFYIIFAYIIAYLLVSFNLV